MHENVYKQFHIYASIQLRKNIARAFLHLRETEKIHH